MRDVCDVRGCALFSGQKHTLCGGSEFREIRDIREIKEDKEFKDLREREGKCERKEKKPSEA